MRILLPYFILVLLLSSCFHHKRGSSQYEVPGDTLVVECKKQKGDGLFTLGVAPSNFADTTATFDHTVIYPLQIADITRDQMVIDLWAEKSNRIDLITGKLGNRKVFVVDENNNKDLRDDSIRIVKPIDWYNDNTLIKCKFFRLNGQSTSLDSSWIRIGEMNNELWYGKSEHLTAEFNVGSNSFKVAVMDAGTISFKYKAFPQIALIKQNEIAKDTLLEKDILQIGEFLNLDGNYYRFVSVDENGRFLTLVKTQNFSNEIGTQVGMLAPDFTCKTVSGDTVRSAELHDKILLVANSCGCGGDEESTQAFYDIKNAYGEKIEILRLDSKIEQELSGMHIDIDDPFNKDIYQKYRNEYCSRTCYVINEENRIVDKFPVSNWMSNLPNSLAHQ